MTLSSDSPPGTVGAPPSGRSLLFVCTGNTCRSPLAEALCKRLLADRLGCPPGELPARGFVVRSAGVAAFAGDAPAAPAVEVAREFGADLSDHRSRPVNPELLDESTDVIAMTHGHAAALLMRFPGYGPAVRLLGGPDGDLDDPIGGDIEVYRACAREIARHLNRWLPGWLGKPSEPTENDRPERTGP